MASISLDFKIDGVEVIKNAVKKIIEETEWEEDAPEEYKKGFYDFGNAVLNVIDELCTKEKQNEIRREEYERN